MTDYTVRHRNHQVRRWNPHTHILSEEADRVFTTCNNMDINLKFKTEHINNSGSQWLLDLQRNVTEEEKLYAEFSRKAACRDMFVQYNSAFPLGAKIRYDKKGTCTNPMQMKQDIQQSDPHFTLVDILKTNRYPRSILNRLKYPRHPTRRIHVKPSKICFFKILHFSKSYSRSYKKRRARQTSRPLQIIFEKITRKETRDKKQCTLRNCPIRDKVLSQRIKFVYRIRCKKKLQVLCE